MHNQPTCPFCNLDNTRIILASTHSIAFYDGFPVTPGHSLIVPVRWFSLEEYFFSDVTTQLV